MFKLIHRNTVIFIVLLILVLTSFSVVFQSYLGRKLNEYEMSTETSAVPLETEEQLIVAAEPYDADSMAKKVIPLEQFMEETNQLKNTTDRMINEKSGLVLRDSAEVISGLWDEEMKNIIDAILQSMPSADRTEFTEKQNAFLKDRSNESLKKVGDGKTAVEENSDYLLSYISQTRTRCDELMKEYASYLDK